MWTPNAQVQHSCKSLRYQNDLTDAEWAVLAPHLPPVCSRGHLRVWATCETINSIFCMMRADGPWRLLPSDFSVWETSYRCFAAFRDEARFEKINHALVMMDRVRAGREVGPSGAIHDSQSVKTTEAARPRDYGAGKWLQTMAREIRLMGKY